MAGVLKADGKTQGDATDGKDEPTTQGRQGQPATSGARTEAEHRLSPRPSGEHDPMDTLI